MGRQPSKILNSAEAKVAKAANKEEIKNVKAELKLAKQTVKGLQGDVKRAEKSVLGIEKALAKLQK